MPSEIENFTDVRVIPTAVINEDRSQEMDDYKKNVIESKKPRFFYEKYMNRDVIRIVNPLIATENCLDCHDTRVGKPLAVISIRYSLEETKASVNDQCILASFIVITFIVLMFIYKLYCLNHVFTY